MTFFLNNLYEKWKDRKISLLLLYCKCLCYCSCNDVMKIFIPYIQRQFQCQHPRMEFKDINNKLLMTFSRDIEEEENNG